MTGTRGLRFYLDDGLLASAQAGQHNFIARIAAAVTAEGWRVGYRAEGDMARDRVAGWKGYALIHMAEPPDARTLTFRRVYHYPFWQIERTGRRWDWAVAKARFDAEACPAQEAARFARFWRKRLFGEVEIADDGFIYVPLQGRLRDHRSFQNASPLEMLRRTRAAFPDRTIIAALHPKEVYSNADLQALDALAKPDPRMDVQMGGMDALLPRCSFVVTQNSAAAFNGFLLHKPAVLFGLIDFHHIALNIGQIGAEAAFDAVEAHAPAYDRYLWWFWQTQSINAGRPEAEARIAETLRARGWPL